MRRLLAMALLTILAATAATPRSPVTIYVPHAALTQVLNALAYRFKEHMQVDPSLAATTLDDVQIPAPDFTTALDFLASVYDLYVQRECDGQIYPSAATPPCASPLYVVLSEKTGHVERRIALFNADPAQVENAIQTTASADLVTVVLDEHANALILVGPPGAVAQVAQLVQQLDGSAPIPPHSVHVPIYHKDPAMVADQVRAMYPQGDGALMIAPDEATGSVLLNGSPSAVAYAQRLVRQIDRPVYQVNVAGRVLDITPFNDTKNLGIMLGGYSATGATGGTLTQPVQNQIYLPFTGNSVAINATINTLIQHNEARVLQTPNITVESGTTGPMHVGSEVPIVYSSGVFGGGNTVTTRDTGITFNVTPIVESGNNIRMTLTISYDQLAGTLNGYPLFNQRSVGPLTVDLAPGQTLDLGGLEEDSSSRTIVKMPLLGDIPLLGRLFRNTQTSRSKEQLVFEITPTIVMGN